jgi:hypothetical protein
MPAGSHDVQRARAEARADLIRRLFAVAISVGFAATLARMTWVQNGTLPNPAELNQTLILGTALLAAILGWDGHLVAMSDKPLFGFWRFLVNLALVFIYMFLLMASAHPECMLWTLAVIFVLYVAWDVLTMREQISHYDPALAGGPAPRRSGASMRAGSRARHTSHPAPRSRWRGAAILSCSRSSETGTPMPTSAPPAYLRSSGWWASGSTPPSAMTMAPAPIPCVRASSSSWPR